MILSAVLMLRYLGEKDADVPKLRYDRYGHSYYMDVTNLVDYGADNEIELSIRNLQKNEFMGPFLMYPGEELTSHVLPKPNHAGKRVVYTKSLVPAGPPRYVKGAKRPVITEAKVMGNVTLTKGTQLRVRVDLPPEKL